MIFSHIINFSNYLYKVLLKVYFSICFMVNIKFNWLLIKYMNP